MDVKYKQTNMAEVMDDYYNIWPVQCYASLSSNLISTTDTLYTL